MYLPFVSYNITYGVKLFAVVSLRSANKKKYIDLLAMQFRHSQFIIYTHRHTHLHIHTPTHSATLYTLADYIACLYVSLIHFNLVWHIVVYVNAWHRDTADTGSCVSLHVLTTQCFSLCSLCNTWSDCMRVSLA